MRKTLITIAVITLFSQQALAETKCNISLQHDLEVTPQQIQLSDDNKTLWRITPQGQLWIDNQAQTTNRQNQALLQRYQADIRSYAKDTAILVADAIELATDAVDQTLTELTGTTSAQFPAMKNALDDIRSSTDSIILKQGDNLYIRGSKLEQTKTMSAEFKGKIQQAVKESAGTMLLMAGQNMLNGEGSFEQRMNTFGQKMEQFGQNLEQRVSVQAKQLETRGQTLCQNLGKLNQTETELQQHFPALKKYDLIKVTP